MRILIRDATVITVDADNRVLNPGSVYIDGARIGAVGGSFDIALDLGSQCGRIRLVGKPLFLLAAGGINCRGFRFAAPVI